LHFLCDAWLAKQGLLCVMCDQGTVALLV